MSTTDLNQQTYWHKITLSKVASNLCYRQNPGKYRDILLSIKHTPMTTNQNPSALIIVQSLL